MLIALWFQATIAVLGFAAVFPQVTTYNSYESLNNTNLYGHTRRSVRKSSHPRDSWQDAYPYEQNRSLKLPGHYLSHRENQCLLHEEVSAENGSGADCCPSVLEMIEPEGGKNMDDIYVDLYRDGEYKQRFYELSCHNEIHNKPCRFMDKKLHEHSKCVQKYSYTYALVKDKVRKDPARHHQHHRTANFPSFPAPGQAGTTWTLDYIRVRSGCSCVVVPNKRKRGKHKPNCKRNTKV